ncbi:MAG: S1-like domain-containing RNA-binding protein [Fibrobacterales bacterium]
MASIGKTATLTVVSVKEFGLYLDGGELGEILIPTRYAPSRAQEGDEISVFIYCDSEDRVIATTEKPFLEAGEYGLLKVAETGSYGAFLNWGLPKDILVPHKEMQREMEQGFEYLVTVYVDHETDRLVASSRLDRHLSIDTDMFSEGDEVSIIVAHFTDMGCKVVVNNHCWGLLFKNEIFQDLKKGDKTTAWIKNIREDGKLDLVLQQAGYDTIDPLSKEIMEKLDDSDGFLPFNDKSAPDEIYDFFGMSKKAFKKALGSLYKERLITIENDGIHKQ